MGPDVRAHHHHDDTPCGASPRCMLSGNFVARYGLPAGTPLYAIHVGPPLDGWSAAAGHPIVLPRGGGWRRSGPLTRARQRPAPEHADRPELSVDYVALRDHAAVDNASKVWLLDAFGATFWILEARAWRRADGPHALWRAPTATHGADLLTRYADGYWTAAAEDEVRRCAALLDRGWRPRRVGRPSARGDDAAWRITTETAEAMKSEHPDWSFDAIARRLHLHPRTLRGYRRRLEAERLPAMREPRPADRRVVHLREVS